MTRVIDLESGELFRLNGNPKMIYEKVGEKEKGIIICYPVLVDPWGTGEYSGSGCANTCDEWVELKPTTKVERVKIKASVV